MQRQRYLLINCVLLGLLTALPGGAAAAEGDDADAKKIKVFLLVGQSNMQGKGSLEHLEELVKSEPDKFGHLKKDGQWIERDDVYIIYPNLAGRDQDQKGKLSVGYTWPPKVKIGPELGFGEVVGDALDNPVLLVKSAWGGQSLDIDFRPPSAGWERTFDPSDRQQWKPGTQGWAYKQIFNNQHIVFEDLGSHFPELKDREYEIAGLVWFQGWNDLIDAKRREAYASNLAHFVRDIRQHLDRPRLPIVVGVMGQDGDQPNDPMKQMRAAQEAVAGLPEFQGNVIAVPTAPYWDPSVQYDGGYHYNGSARFYYDAGRAFGEAMLSLLKKNE